MNFFKKKHLASNPIFVGGDGRSGTTLLSVILNAHPKLAVGPELHFSGPKNLGEYVAHCTRLLEAGDPSVFGSGLKENPDLKSGVQFAKRCHRMGIGFDELSEIIKKQSMNSSLDSFRERCQLVDALGKRLIEKFDADRWGIKIMREIRSCDEYAKIWPKASFIHIIRDGRDVAASQLLDHGKWGYASVSEAAISWCTLISKTRSKAKKLKYLEIRYEDLVLDPKTTIQVLLDFLGYEFCESMLDHTTSYNPIFDNPYNHPSIDQIKKPLSSDSIGRFKKDFTSSEIDEFNKQSAELLSDLKYL